MHTLQPHGIDVVLRGVNQQATPLCLPLAAGLRACVRSGTKNRAATVRERFSADDTAPLPYGRGSDETSHSRSKNHTGSADNVDSRSSLPAPQARVRTSTRPAGTDPGHGSTGLVP